MSGICGCIFGNEKNNGIQADLNIMKSWIIPYGKDDSAIVCENGMGLACCYEKISLNSCCKLPVLVRKEKYAVIDAIIYNSKELKTQYGLSEELSDEELLFELISNYGINILQEVNGDFCGAVVDSVSKEVLLFRDHMGVRPLFYYLDEEKLLFSTDIRSIVAVKSIDLELNTKKIFAVSHGYSEIQAEETEFANIKCVMPASCVKIAWGKRRVKKTIRLYWKLGKRKIKLSSEKQYQDMLRELIVDSIKKRLDVFEEPVGAELSGGLDSSVIDILINRLGKKGLYFSWSVDPEEIPFALNDERLIVADICKQENIECYYKKRNIDFSDSNLINSLKSVGVKIEPNENIIYQAAFPTYINTLNISVASQFVNEQGGKVIFSGHGGDEGVSRRNNAYEMFHRHEYYRYLRYAWSRAYGQKWRAYKTIRNCFKNILSSRKIMHSAFRYPRIGQRILCKEIDEQYSEKMMPENTFMYDAKRYILEGGTCNRLYNCALQGAYSGVRYVFPYLDYRVIDYAVSIPRYLFLKGGSSRYIFRETFKDIMPDSLHALKAKDEPSHSMIQNEREEQLADKIATHMEVKKQFIDLLDRDYWEQYLDYDVLDAWLNKTYTSEEELLSDEGIGEGVFYCVKVDNLIKKARSI